MCACWPSLRCTPDLAPASHKHKLGMQEMDGGPEKMMENCIINVCQPGSSLLCAGYCLYSSATNFVLTIGKGTMGFTYDSMVGEFIMSHPNIKVRQCH